MLHSERHTVRTVTTVRCTYSFSVFSRPTPYTKLTEIRRSCKSSLDTDIEIIWYYTIRIFLHDLWNRRTGSPPYCYSFILTTSNVKVS